MEELLKEQRKTNELLETLLNVQQTGKDLNELLTVEDVVTEFKIGLSKVKKMFNDPNLPVQRYTKPFKVQRKAIYKYFEDTHDYLCDQ